jgi:predicted PurR-regulated permease PerM
VAEQPLPKFFLALMILATVLLALVLAPVAKELVLAAVVATVLWPVQRWLAKRLRGRRGVAAGIVSVAVILLVLGPVATIVTIVIRDGAEGVQFISQAVRSEEVAALVGRLPDTARDWLTDEIARLPQDTGQVIDVIGDSDKTVSTVGRALAATGSFALHTVLMLIALFFLLVRGNELVTWLEDVSPLGREPTAELFATFRKVSYAVIVSSGVTAAVQAAAALAGFLIARAPSPYFFALVTFFCAFIPAIGASVVSLLAALLLLVTGHPFKALFLAVWGIAVVGIVDNLVKPLLIKRGMEIHGAVVFFALIGGLATFGPIGLLLGPLTVSLFLAMLRMYHRDYTPSDATVPAIPGHPATETPPAVDSPAPPIAVL